MAVECSIERNEGVTTFTFRRPEVRNALTEAMIAQLADALDEASADAGVRAFVLTGAGEAFCSGADTRLISAKTGVFEGASAPRTRHGYTHGVQRMTRAFSNCEVPVIAAVNGPALGLGFDIAMQCDIRIAAPSATFSEAFVHVGLIPGDGGFWHLPRIVGYARAVELTATGRRIDAATAAAWGMVSEVTEPDGALEAALTLAKEMAAKSPHAVRLSKRLIRAGMNGGLDTALELGALAQAVLTGSADQNEAVAALGERRRPSFTGA